MGFLNNIPILKKLIDFTSSVIIIIILSALVGLILAFPVKLLWNYVFPMYEISYFQAWALNVLAGILFGQKSSK